MEPQVSGLQAVCSRGGENGKVLAGKMWSTLWRSKRWWRKRSLFLVYLKVFEYIIPDGKTLLIAFVRICASIESFCLTRRLRVCEYSADYLRDPLFSDSGGRSTRNSHLSESVDRASFGHDLAITTKCRACPVIINNWILSTRIHFMLHTDR